MSTATVADLSPPEVDHRARELFDQHMDSSYRLTDRMFAVLLVIQWAAAILVAVVVSPYGWAGKEHVVHLHVQIAVLGGLVINSLPLALVYLRPGTLETRLVIAVAQMLWSALLIHLSGGRIETHFHVFGSLAFLAFYRDWRVLVPATVVVAGDHVLRQFLYPESVYGISNPEWWRFIEHAGWVVFEDIVLFYACIRGSDEMRELASRQAMVEALSAAQERKSHALDVVLNELRSSQDLVVRSEKLAAVGQLAASVGHELRNPLAAIQNAHTYITRRIGKGGDLQQDARVGQFSTLIDKELGACTRIISDLLDFARDRQPALRPCPLRALVDDALAVVPAQPGAAVTNEVPELLPVPSLDPDQFRQVLVNLVQNAVEAVAGTSGGTGSVTIRASGGFEGPFQITVSDDGPGMPAQVVERIFQPLYTTKTKGTGLGLAIVATIVQRHQGRIWCDSTPGRGTTFTVEVPPAPAAAT